MSTKNTCCRICGNKDLYKFLELGPQPPANAFLTPPNSSHRLYPDFFALQFKNEKYYPLDVYFCPSCGLVQLTDIVNPDTLFRDYAYYTGKSSETMKRHFKELAKKLTEEFDLCSDDLIIDIGSNDGTFLKNFKCRRIGVDPAENIAKQANLNGVKTFPCFFTADSAWKILNKVGKAKVITATNVFAHVNNLYDFMAGVRCLLEDDGVFVIEVPHFMELYKNKEFDTIYHEHLSYFLVGPLVELFSKFRLKITKVEKIPVHGGSIRIYVKDQGHAGHFGPTIVEEAKQVLYTKDTYQTFADKVRSIKEDLVTLLTKLKAQGNRIVGYGAPAKGNTLLNYCKIGPDILDYLTDTTPYKQGKYSPGMHIPVVSPDVFHKDPPDYALMLPWNYQTEILKKEREFLKNGGQFIIPIPELEVIGIW